MTTRPSAPALLDIQGEGHGGDHQIRVGVTDGRVDAVHIARGMIDPDRPQALEAAVREAVNNALDDQQHRFNEKFLQFAEQHRREHPELPALAARLATIAQGERQ